jgi:putative tricarboxylic transport membrane protein
MSKKLFVVPLFLALLSFIIIYLSLQIENSPEMIVGDSMQPRSFPIFLMAINLILLGVLSYQFYKNYPKPIVLEHYPTWATLFLFIVFYVLTTNADLFIGISLVMFLIGWIWGEKRLWVNLLNSILTPFLIFVLFDNVLKVRFPRGILTNLYYG